MALSSCSKCCPCWALARAGPCVNSTLERLANDDYLAPLTARLWAHKHALKVRLMARSLCNLPACPLQRSLHVLEGRKLKRLLDCAMSRALAFGRSASSLTLPWARLRRNGPPRPHSRVFSIFGRQHTFLWMAIMGSRPGMGARASGKCISSEAWAHRPGSVHST